MAKSTNTNKKNEETTNQPAPKNEIVQPDKNNPDSQAHIKANAQKGQPVPTPMGSITMQKGQNVPLTEK